MIRYIGSKHVSKGDPKKEGFGGVHPKGASRATISDDRFLSLENNGASPAGVHGVYAANNSDGTVIEKNRFGHIPGDPIRFRHGSDNARVTSNRFWRTGCKAIVSDRRFKSEKCGKGTVLKNNTAGNRTYTNAEYGSDASRNKTPPPCASGARTPSGSPTSAAATPPPSPSPAATNGPAAGPGSKG